MQSIIQKYVTHSISSTINLPENVTEKKVSEIYLRAWSEGLKGITIYREGSRSGVLLDEKEKETRLATHVKQETPERPQTLAAEVIRFMNKNKRWIAVIGLNKGSPYEIFTGEDGPAFLIPHDITQGKVIKQKSGQGKTRYDFQFTDISGATQVREGLSNSFNPEYWNYARLISGILRQGMPLPQVVHLVETLHLESDQINTWKNGVARALRKFIPDGTPVTDHQCEVCGDKDGIIYEEGCLKCKSCGYSLCG
jgi:ribonucleoside-diphosphate reductase alpha chain